MKKIDNACAGKVKYESLEKANESVKNLNKLGGTRLNSYRCPICNFIHLGHDGRSKKLKPMDSYKNRDIHYVHVRKTHIVDLGQLKFKTKTYDYQKEVQNNRGSGKGN